MQKILLVDDDEINIFLSKLILSQTSIIEQIDIVYNGQEALSFIQEKWAEFKTYDKKDLRVVMLDISMPIMDGFEFLEHFKQLAGYSDVRIAILSSSVSEVDKAKSKGYNMVIDYIEKPLTKDKLELLLDKLNL